MPPTLTDHQIAETLRHFGLPGSAELLGIRYEYDQSQPITPERVVMVVRVDGQVFRATVPPAILAEPGPEPEEDEASRTLFDRPTPL